jgi:PAS domain S-box-containing protein
MSVIETERNQPSDELTTAESAKPPFDARRNTEKRRWFQLAGLPIPLLLVTMAVAASANLGNMYSSPRLLLALNFMFSTLASLVVAYLVGRSFLTRRAPGLLMLGCGVVLWGSAGAAAVAISRGDVNVNLTIFAWATCLAALCHLTGICVSLRPRRALDPAGVWLAVGYGAAFIALGLVSISAIDGMFPVFFVQGQGSTFFRQLVLGSAVAMFALAAILLRTTNRKSLSPFSYWYSYALALIAAGLFGTVLASSFSSVLFWVGRAGSWLGGVYMLIAAIASVRESRVWGISLEAALRESDARFRSMYEHAAVGIAQLANDGSVLMANSKLCRMLGYSEGELLGQTMTELTHPDDRERDALLLEPVLRGERDLFQAEKRYLHRDGSSVWVHVTSSVVKDDAAHPLYRVAIVQDITERKQAEARIKRLLDTVQQERDRLSALINSIHDEVWFADTEKQFTLANLAAFRGFSFDSTASTDVERMAESLEVYRPDGSPRPVEEAPPLRALAGEVVNDREEIVRIPATGELRHRQVSAAPVKDATGNIIGSVSVVRDITERKRAEEELVAAKESAENAVAQLRATIDSMTEGMFVVTPDHKRPLVNAAYFRIYGFEPDSSPDAAEKVGSLLERYDMNGRILSLEEQPASLALRGITVVQREVRVRRVDTGREVVTSVNCTPVRDASGKVTMAVITVEDITAKKQAEQALLRSEKLASVGRMAASIAHEINNPLAAMVNTLYLARTNADDAASVRQYLDIADDELKRVSHITRQTLGFYRESSAPMTVSVSSVVDAAVDLLRAKIKLKRANIEKQYDGDLQVTGVPGELRQVFSNLLVNSLDAIGEEGTIKVRVSMASCTNGGQPRVRVTVADNGTGIDAAALPRIFEPLFTTKESTGSGLGLWVSKQILEKHNGSIRVRSRTNGLRRGTSFSIVLAAEPAAAAHSQSAGA